SIGVLLLLQDRALVARLLPIIITRLVGLQRVGHHLLGLECSASHLLPSADLSNMLGSHPSLSARIVSAVHQHPTLGPPAGLVKPLGKLRTLRRVLGLLLRETLLFGLLFPLHLGKALLVGESLSDFLLVLLGDAL